MKKYFSQVIPDPENYVFVIHQSKGKPYLIDLKDWKKSYQGEVACVPMIQEGNTLIRTAEPVEMIDKGELDPIVGR